MRNIENIATAVIDEAFKLHSEVGPGLLESFYQSILFRKLQRRGFDAGREVLVSFEYEGETFSDVFRADLIVESCLLVEFKSIERLHPVHTKQVLTYLRVLKMPLGLLINMGSALFKDGVVRVLNARADQRALIDRKAGDLP